MSGTNITQFGNDVPPNKLPQNFQDAITASLKGTNTVNDDNTIGSLQYGYGYCSQQSSNPDKNYSTMTYCACVNAPIANPECVFLDCANSGNSYKNTLMQQVISDRSQNCPNTVTCEQVFQMGGSSNIAEDVNPVMNCGGIVATYVTNIQSHPFIAIVVLILLLSVVLLITSRKGPASGGRTLPPPQLIMPSNV